MEHSKKATTEQAKVQKRATKTSLAPDRLGLFSFKKQTTMKGDLTQVYKMMDGGEVKRLLVPQY